MNDVEYDAIIFDLDGTLVDSLNVWTEADRKFIESLGFEYDIEISHGLKTMHFDGACEHLIKVFSLDKTVEQVSAAISDCVLDGYMNDVSLKPFVREFIESEYKKGVRMCVATSNKKTLAESLLKKLGLLDFFEFVVTSDEVGSNKESPDIFFHSAARLGSVPEKTVVFEDFIHAVKTASEAGFYTVGVYDDYSAHEFDLVRRTADRVIMDFGEMLGENIRLQHK
jgi:HAD superfamily hydrolase (TIGR01509 family)